MGNTLKVPATTERVIRLNKVSQSDRLFGGRCNKPFFREGYPTPKIFRNRFSQDAWNRLDNEFLNVWNSTLASNTSWGCKCLAIFPGIYLLCVPFCYVSNMAEKREKAMHEVVAKANKYIFRPRGMFMKERVIAEGHDSSRREIAWYEIALTPGEVSRLEKQKTYEVGGYCCCDPNDYVTEDTVEEDLDFQRRWSGGSIEKFDDNERGVSLDTRGIPQVNNKYGCQMVVASNRDAKSLPRRTTTTTTTKHESPVYNENPIFNAR